MENNWQFCCRESTEGGCTGHIKHTPTPWKIAYEGDAEKCKPAIIMARSLEIRVSRAEDFGDPLPDAAFIVKVVNCHEELVKVIQHYIFLQSQSYDDATWRRANVRAQLAIAKAEGK